MKDKATNPEAARVPQSYCRQKKKRAAEPTDISHPVQSAEAEEVPLPLPAVGGTDRWSAKLNILSAQVTLFLRLHGKERKAAVCGKYLESSTVMDKKRRPKRISNLSFIDQALMKILPLLLKFTKEK